MIKVSIIIPMYNVAHYLNTCIQSILDQNLKENTFEVIMVNDESPDNSLEIAKQLASKYSFIKVISQKNKGLGGARNFGIDQAQGNYLLFLDADDSLIPNTLNRIISIADKKNIDILEFAANLVDSYGNTIASVVTNSNNKVYNGVQYYNAIKYSGSACNKLYASAFINKYKLRFLEKIYGEDFEFNTRSFYRAQRVIAIDVVGAQFLQSPNSITRNKSKVVKDKYLQDFISILKSINNFKQQEVDNYNNESVNNFFNERLTMVNINAFYLMFKNKYSFEEMNDFKNELISQNLLFIKHPVKIRKKEVFRKYILHNFKLFKISQPILKIFK